MRAVQLWLALRLWLGWGVLGVAHAAHSADNFRFVLTCRSWQWPAICNQPTRPLWFSQPWCRHNLSHCRLLARRTLVIVLVKPPPPTKKKKKTLNETHPTSWVSFPVTARFFLTKRVTKGTNCWSHSYGCKFQHQYLVLPARASRNSSVIRVWSRHFCYQSYAFILLTCGLFCSMDGGELFSRIQDRGDQAFTERGRLPAALILLSHSSSFPAKFNLILKFKPFQLMRCELFCSAGIQSLFKAKAEV